MKHIFILILYNFIHVFLFFLIPFQLITCFCDVNGFWNFSFFCLCVSCWCISQTIMYITLLKKWLPNTFEYCLKEIRNV